MLGTTRCPVVAGWEDRMRQKIGIAATAGTGIGAVLALAKGHPILRFTATSAVSFTALGALYTGIEETCRLVRCHASPVNAAVAGAAVGSIVHRANGRSPMQGAVSYAALAAAATALATLWRPGETLRDLLVRVDLLDPPSPNAAAAEGARRSAAQAWREQRAAPPQDASPEEGWLVRLGNAVGMRRMSESEWTEYLEEQERRHRERTHAAIYGAGPATRDAGSAELGPKQ